MTTTTPAKPRTKRATVPAPDKPAVPSPALAALTGEASTTSTRIDVDVLRPHPANPRRDLGDLTELTDSIRAHGVRQNLLVVPDPDEDGAYRLVIGHRRTAAARLAGVTHLPAVVDAGLTATDQLELMLLENIQRSDLSAVEEADAYQGLLDLGMDIATISTRTGRSSTTVRSRLRLASLPEQARSAVHERTVTLADAAALEEFDDDPETQTALAEALGTNNFSGALESARRCREHDAAFAPYIKHLTDAGAVHSVVFAPTGLALAGRTSRYYVEQDEPGSAGYYLTSAELTRAIADAGPGWMWVRQYDQLTVYRPLTLEEIAAETERDAAIAARDAAREADNARYQAEREERAARDAARRDLAEVAVRTRHEFLEHLIHDRKLTQHEVGALVGYVGFEILRTAWDEDDGLGSDAGDVPPWLRVDVDVDAPDPDAAVHHAIAAMPPANRLLAALAAAAEPIAAWRLSGTVRATVAWYALLEELGYAVSDAERAAITSAPTGGES